MFCFSADTTAGALLINWVILFTVPVLQMFIETRCGTSLGGYIHVAKHTMSNILKIRMMSGVVQLVKSQKDGSLPTSLNKMTDKISSSSIFSSCCSVFNKSTNRLGCATNWLVLVLHWSCHHCIHNGVAVANTVQRKGYVRYLRQFSPPPPPITIKGNIHVLRVLR